MPRPAASLANLKSPWTTETAREANRIRWSIRPTIPEITSPNPKQVVPESPIHRINHLISVTTNADRITKLVKARDRLVQQQRQLNHGHVQTPAKPIPKATFLGRAPKPNSP